MNRCFTRRTISGVKSYDTLLYIVLSNKKSVFKGFMSPARYFYLFLNNTVKNLEAPGFFMYISMKKLNGSMIVFKNMGDIGSFMDGRFS